jgi:hypothetical protein
MSAYIKKSERSQINDLMLHLKLLETSRRSEIVKIRAQINEIETNKETKNDTRNQ